MDQQHPTPLVKQRRPEKSEARIAEISVMRGSRADSSRMAAETETVRAAADGSLPFKTQK